MHTTAIVMNIKIYFHTWQHPKWTFINFSQGYGWKNVKLILMRSISTLFISDSNALNCLLDEQLHMQLDCWNFWQPTCHWQLHAWFQNKTEHIAELTTVNTSWTTKFITSLICQRKSALKLTYPSSSSSYPNKWVYKL